MFFEEIIKMNKPLAQLIRIKREKTQITTIRNERGDISTDSPDIRGVIGNITSNFVTISLAN